MIMMMMMMTMMIMMMMMMMIIDMEGGSCKLILRVSLPFLSVKRDE